MICYLLPTPWSHMFVTRRWGNFLLSFIIKTSLSIYLKYMDSWTVWQSVSLCVSICRVSKLIEFSMISRGDNPYIEISRKLARIDQLCSGCFVPPTEQSLSRQTNIECTYGHLARAGIASVLHQNTTTQTNIKAAALVAIPNPIPSILFGLQ